MKNYFRDILNSLPPSKIEIIPTEPSEKKIAKQMTDLINWKIVQSRADFKTEDC